jgi:hypothetical protein
MHRRLLPFQPETGRYAGVVFAESGVVDELVGPAVPPAAVALSIAGTTRTTGQFDRHGGRGLTAKHWYLLTSPDGQFFRKTEGKPFFTCGAPILQLV